MLLGLSNTAGVLAGVLGTAATGYILQRGKTLSALSGYLRVVLDGLCHFVASVKPFPVLRKTSFTGSWDDVFKVAVVLYVIGTLVWNFFSTGEKVLD